MLLTHHNESPSVLPYDKNRAWLFFSVGTYSAKDKISLDKAASSMREVASSATVPSDGNNSTTDEALEAQEENRKESFISDRREPSFVSLVENSLAGTKISSDGREMERCEGCGRTFAPGRLHSHAKASVRDFP